MPVLLLWIFDMQFFKEVKHKANKCALLSYRIETIERNSFNYKAWDIQLVSLINYFNVDMM